MGQWQSQMCPILTVGLQKPAPEPSRIVGVGVAAPTPASAPTEFPAFPCHGPACAWFQNIADASGNVVDGRCAVPLLAVGFGSVANILDSLRKVATPPVVPSKA